MSISFLVLALCATSVISAPTAETLDPRQTTGLNAKMQAKGKYYGTFSDNRYLTDQPYTAILGNTNEFSSITPGNSMKWDSTEPSRGSFSFSTADGIVNFAKSHNQKIRGHTLVWHSQLPSWVSSITSASDLQNAMNNHITTVMNHWKGQNVVHWDVVNEPFDDSGAYRNSVFYKLLGKGYIAQAFRTARSVDPNAKLYLNEYNNDSGAKGDAFYNLAKELKSAGVPIDGVGIQGHYILGGIPSGLQSRMQQLADLGLDVAITELDIRIQSPTTSAKLQQQANDYAAVVKACMAVSRCVGITVASFTDKYSWVPGTFAGYDDAHQWDKNLAKKPSYTSALNAIV